MFAVADVFHPDCITVSLSPFYNSILVHFMITDSDSKILLAELSVVYFLCLSPRQIQKKFNRMHEHAKYIFLCLYKPKLYKGILRYIQKK